MLTDAVVLDVSTPAARRAAAWRLLQASGKPQDGWLSRHVHRKASRLFSHMFLELGLSANVATTLTFCVGLLAAYMMAQTSHRTIPAAIAVGLAVVVVTLVGYGPTLDRALRETVGPRPAGTATAPAARGSSAPA